MLIEGSTIISLARSCLDTDGNSTVSKVLRNRSKYFGSSASGTDSPSRLGIEKQLLEWALDQDDPMLSDEMIQQQAAIIAKRMSSENSNPAHSSKWLRKFKRDVRMKLATRNSSVQSGGSASPEYLSEPALHEMSSWDSLRSKSSRNATIAAAGIFADTAGVNTMRDFTHIDPRLHNQSSYLSLGGASSTSMAPDAIMGATSSDLSRPIDMVRRHTVPGSNRPQPPPSTMDNFYDPNMHLYLPAPTDSPMQNYDYTTIKPHSLDTTIQPSSSYDAFGDYSLATMDGLNYHHQNSDVVPRSLPTPRHDHTVVGEEEATLATALENYKARAVARGALAEAIDAVLESLRPPPTDGLE